MANYYIDIIDTLSDIDQLVIRFASKGGMTLNWSGGDEKDGLGIVGSNFSFDLLDEQARDAYYIGFFTGDEKRFHVLVKKSDDDSIIWQGHIVPDLYSEPYQNGIIFVNIAATDGLGRLKGKYLPDEFYSREKSLIEIFTNILLLTGLELNLYFAPAIENFQNKDWNTIYIDTVNFLDNNKKLDAYKILEMLLKDTVSVCYQSDNRWYIEGLNVRMLRSAQYKIYNTVGVLIGSLTYNRLLKQVKALVTPIITIIPPYNEITVTHKKIASFIPKTAVKEENEGWAVVTGVIDKIQSTSWMGNGGLNIECSRPDYDCVVFSKGYFDYAGNIDYPHDPARFVTLRKKLFFSKSQKVKFDFEFKIKYYESLETPPSDLNLWKNPFYYEILFNGVVLYDNYIGIVADKEKVIFNQSGDAKIAIEHIFTEDGLLDLKIYAPFGTSNNNKIGGIILSKLEIDAIDFVEEFTETNLINGDFTVDKELNLDYSDDKSGFSKGFRLAKLKEETTFYNSFDVPILYSFVLNGKNYSVVQLYGLNLIKENLAQVYFDDEPIDILSLAYNFNDGEQMVVETENLYTSGNFVVKKYAVDDVVSSRTHWVQWTDYFYKIENLSYTQIVANIYRRMFNIAHEKLDLVALQSVKFNDIILFHYEYIKYFCVLNCSWNLDQNKTTLTLGRMIYKDGSSDPNDENIPPIVLAGDDIYIGEDETEVTFNATAFDPDGYIASQIWTKMIGGFGDIIVSPGSLTTVLQNLTEDQYQYQIKVVDNDGAEATDVINVIRVKDYVVDLVLVTDSIDYFDKYVRYQFVVTPEIVSGFVLNFSGVIAGVASASGYSASASAGYEMYKNGVLITPSDGNTGISGVEAYALNYISGDIIYFDLILHASPGDSGSGDNAFATASVSLTEVKMINGNAIISGLPIYKNEEVHVP